MVKYWVYKSLTIAQEGAGLSFDVFVEQIGYGVNNFKKEDIMSVQLHDRMNKHGSFSDTPTTRPLANGKDLQSMA